ncbi:MAG: RsmE family RNA methyltransferase [Candidatus Magasanikbacteria bacterium]
MKRHYFIGQFNWDVKEIECLDTEIIHQIEDVLKIKIGEEVVLCDGEGKTAIVTLEQIDKKVLVFSLVNFLPVKKSNKHVILCAAMLKRDSFEWLLQKAVEVGVDEIVPIISERTIKIGVNEKRWQKIIKEAAEQSERQVLPKLSAPQSFKDALKTKAGQAIFFDPSGIDVSKSKIKGKDVALFIGPEGGWSENEVKLAQSAGIEVSSLGESILRGETAGIVAVYLAKNVF